jgi:uncharacterized surface protein with fasciclin (FAS1) repeats
MTREEELVMYRFITAVAASVLMVTAVTNAQMEKTVTVGGAAMYPSKDIIDNAVNSKDHTTLVAAVKAAGLVDTLKGNGPFTVFAPTNAAFAKLPAGTLEALLADPARLTKVLTYHVVPGNVMAADVMKLSSAKTVEGQSIKISKSAGVKVDNANVVQTDIVASNGVIHVIDAVIVPR